MYLKAKLVCLIWQTAEGKLRFSFNLWCRFNNKNRSQNSERTVFYSVQLQTMLQVTYQSSVSCSSTDTRARQLMTVSETGPSSADNISPPLKNSLSEGTEVVGIPKYFSARCTSLGYLVSLSFHQRITGDVDWRYFT